MICRNGVCRNHGREYAYALGRRRTILCEPCHASLTGIGMALTPVGPDTRPAWVRRNLASDRTGALVA